MIYILEGVNGVGKTRYAKMLREQLDIPIVRPFRNGSLMDDCHWNADPKLKSNKWQTTLEAMGVPINTHVDDLYVADFLATFRMDCILDRSVPSAVAYGILHHHRGGWYDDGANVTDLLELWQRTMHILPSRYVWLRAPYEVAKNRASGWTPNKKQYDVLDKTFARCFRWIRMPKRQINTAEVTAEDGVAQIIRAADAESG